MVSPDDEGDTSRITLRLPEPLKGRAEELAAQRGQSLNTWIVNAVRAATTARRRRSTSARRAPAPPAATAPPTSACRAGSADRARRRTRHDLHCTTDTASPTSTRPKGTSHDHHPRDPLRHHRPDQPQGRAAVGRHEPARHRRHRHRRSASSRTASTAPSSPSSFTVEARGNDVVVLAPKERDAASRFGKGAPSTSRSSSPRAAPSTLKTGSGDVAARAASATSRRPPAPATSPSTSSAPAELKSGSGDITARAVQRRARRQDRLGRHQRRGQPRPRRPRLGQR